MKLIKLTKGYFAKVDDDKFDFLNSFKWQACVFGDRVYAIRTEQKDREKVKVRMHRVVMDLSRNDKRVVDHSDHDCLNNQVNNLRICTQAQNSFNRRKTKKPKACKYKGVSLITSRWYSQSKQMMMYSTIKYRAAIRVNNKLITIGDYKTELEAAHEYNSAAKAHFGDFANLNDV